MLDISRLEGGLDLEMIPVELESSARASMEAHRWDAESREVELVLDAAGKIPSVIGNAEWLRQAFDNLISNSLKFTPKGGTVTVSIANSGEGVKASVADTGIGIPQADVERIFERFYRASNRSKVNAPGTGLGLAICRSIVDKHEGRVWVESEVGKGTTFFFVIPVAKNHNGPVLS